MLLRRLILTLLVCLPLAMASATNSIRFFGGLSSNDADRIKIQIDDPANNLPGPPADVGVTDFTIEFWVKGTQADNPTGAISCGVGSYNWIDGNIILDRDRFGQPNEFGVSFGAGRVAFGTDGGTNFNTICGTSNVLDGQWHHIALQRRVADGRMWIHVDGMQEAQGDGDPGDMSYPNNGVPSNNSFCGGPCVNEPYIVLGAEKHDLVEGFNGFKDELRLSETLRYSGMMVTPPSAPFVPDAMTAALYHFNEGMGSDIIDSTPGNLSPGVLFFGQGGGAMPGPIWTTDTPFSGAPVPGTLQFAAANYMVGEGSGTATISVTRIGGTTGAATVDYATSDGTATSGADYAANMGTLSWANGDGATKTFDVVIIGDADVEVDETVNLTLSNATGAGLGAPAAALITIEDDDTPGVPGTLQLSTASYNASEANGSVTIAVTRIGGSSGAVTVDYATSNGSATAGSDYSSTTGSLGWVDGDSSPKTFLITITDDNVDENNETVNIALSNPGGGSALGAVANAILTIIDNDTAGGGGGGGGGTLGWLLLTILLVACRRYRNRYSSAG